MPSHLYTRVGSRSGLDTATAARLEKVQGREAGEDDPIYRSTINQSLASTGFRHFFSITASACLPAGPPIHLISTRRPPTYMA